MKTLYIQNGTGLDQKEHILVREMGNRKMPVADFGLAYGNGAAENLRRAKLFILAPELLNTLEQLSQMVVRVNPKFPLGEGFAKELIALGERAERLCSSVKS